MASIIFGVQIDLDALPDNTAVLQQMLRSLVLQHGELHAENDKLRLLIQRLMRHQFGRRSEQLSPDQLQLGLENWSRRSPPTRRPRTAPPRSARRASRAPNSLVATMARSRRTCRATR